VALICDTDDPYFVPADGVSFDAALAPHLELMKHLCATAHVVTVTTPALKQELATFARNIMVMPNMIDTDAAPQRRGNNARVRLGWCGGPTHADDLAVFLPAVAALQRQTDVQFVLFGMFDQNFDRTVQKARLMTPQVRAQNPAVAAFGRMADALKGVHCEHVPSVPYGAFSDRLAALNFDIGVCPLQDTRFNRCRSAVKFYQYAAANTVTVASGVQAYQGECSLLTDNTVAGWLEALLALVNDEQARQQALAIQRRYVIENRSWRVGLELYVKLFTAVCAAVKRGATK
jgi:glycosyltransferase involved in cell wall biosynthesis